MHNRPTRVQTWMEIAFAFAKRSTCMRRNVGAIIVNNRQIISHGYNGVPSGHSHCSGNSCPGKHVCHLTTHAEENALKRIPKGLLFVGPMDIYTTDSPCPACAAAIASSPISRVFFAIPYRLTDPLDYLIANNIEVYQVQPAGYVMNWKTRELIEVDT